MNRIFQIILLVFVQFWVGLLGLQARADNMSTFLKNCAYGTLAGATVGLASLAISDNPGGKINNLARGASLGLYLGIGYGLYVLNNPDQKDNEYTPLLKENQVMVWFSPVVKDRVLQSGAEVHWIAGTF